MLHALSILLNPSIFVIALNLIELILFVALLYLAILYPRT